MKPAHRGQRETKENPASPGVAGSKGEPGADGYTPVRGVDYWTAADKAEIDAHIGERTRKTVYVLPSGYLWDMETKTQYSITSLISGFSEIEDAEFLLTKCKFVYYDPDAYVLPGYTVLCDLNACYDGGTLYLDGVLNVAGEKILYSGSWYVTSPDFAEETITMTGTNVTGSENGGYYTPSIDSAGNLSWSASKTACLRQRAQISAARREKKATRAILRPLEISCSLSMSQHRRTTRRRISRCRK